MIKKNASGYFGIIVSIFVLLVTIGSIRYLDAEIAVKVMRFLLSVRTLHKVTKHIPDFLPHLVGIGTILMWIIYFYRSRHNINDIETHFLRLAATALPVAYLLKSFFKFMFGRTGPRSWLIDNRPFEFHWFNKIWSGSFPSGHMTVFAAFGAAVLFYYPEYRRLVIILLVLLGIALIGTDYHFLSDVIAGTYLGFVTTYLLQHIFEKKQAKI